MTNRSRINNPPILTQKQPKVAIFDKTDFWGLKYSPEVRVKRKTYYSRDTCSILNQLITSAINRLLSFQRFYALIAIHIKWQHFELNWSDGMTTDQAM